MQIIAFPARVLAVTDGVRQGREHVVLFLDSSAGGPCGFALDLADARRLLTALSHVLADAEGTQARLTESN